MKYQFPTRRNGRCRQFGAGREKPRNWATINNVWESLTQKLEAMARIADPNVHPHVREQVLPHEDILLLNRPGMSLSWPSRCQETMRSAPDAGLRKPLLQSQFDWTLPTGAFRKTVDKIASLT